MNVTLPPPLDIYVSAEASTDVERLADCFASDAVVRDEGRTITGLDAIKAWKKDTKARYQYTLQPLDVIQNKSAVKMRARLMGKFPGSPIEVTYRFELADGKIVRLEIQ
jgi:hypothetical protein